MLRLALRDAACMDATALVFGEQDRAYAALRGLGVDPNPELEWLIRVRVLQTVAWSALVFARGAKSRSWLDHRLAWLNTN
jgi:hypothetical protein